MAAPRVSLVLLLAAFVVVACGNLPGNEAVVCHSETKNVGPGCVATYDLCKGGTYKLQCDPSGGKVQCACIENNALKQTFSSDDACNVSPDTLKKRASAGCGWTLD